MVAIGILTALYVGGGVREPVVAWPTSHQFPVTHDEWGAHRDIEISLNHYTPQARR